jgi:hypothetical protein
LLNHGARHDFSGPKSLLGIASTKKKLSIAKKKKTAPMESVSTKKQTGSVYEAAVCFSSRRENQESGLDLEASISHGE